MKLPKDIEVRVSTISGQGTFAKEFIPQGSYITTLTGKPFYKADIDEICHDLNLSNDYPLQIDEHTMMILENPAAKINHSCQPNTGLRHLCDLYAITDIQVGQELTYDYSTTVGVDDPVWRMPCRCGTPRCRLDIGYVLSLPADVLTQYIELDILPDFIKDELKNR